MAIQASYEWITPPRLRVLGQLAENHTEQETAVRLGMKYNTVRGIVAHIENQTGLSDVREIGRWWRAELRSWLWWAAKEAGLPLESGAAQVCGVPTVRSHYDSTLQRLCDFAC